MSGRRLAVLLAAHVSSLLSRAPNRVGVARDMTMTLLPVLDALVAEMQQRKVNVREIDTLAEMIANDWVAKYRENSHKYPSQGAALALIRDASTRLLNEPLPRDLSSRERDPHTALGEARAELRKLSLQLGDLASQITALTGTCAKLQRKADQIAQEVI